MRRCRERRKGEPVASALWPSGLADASTTLLDMQTRNNRGDAMARPKAKWPFDDPPNVATITVRQIVENGDPILLVVRDAEDGGWQFLTGGAFDVADGMVVSLHNIFERDPTIAGLADLEPGWQATRKRVGVAWKREQSEE
jgi:hypothetical protein